MMSSPATIRELVQEADVVIGAVLIHGAKAPKLITREMLLTMRSGAVIVDVSIDQGGCFETSKPTTHSDPTYEVDGILHYCVANMPGAVPLTSTIALTNATLPYAIEIANQGWKTLSRQDPGFKAGINVVGGHVTYKGVAEAFGIEYLPLEEAIK
jgi:alanine dehydrogenase